VDGTRRPLGDPRDELTTAGAAELVVLAHGASWDRRFQVSSLAASAAAAGERVAVALFFAALAAWVEGRWDALDPDPPVDPARLAAADFPPLTEVLAGGRESGRIRLYACTASTRILGLDPAEVQRRVDVLAGWPTFARLTRQAGRVVSF
jgi:peroxiredoxin family protein